MAEFHIFILQHPEVNLPFVGLNISCQDLNSASI